ncbi:MAG: hypothetical protein KGL19_16760, partial [Bacteroidota bacterium]|nr:hypothetical protein [Bacteroidota bacterium]
MISIAIEINKVNQRINKIHGGIDCYQKITLKDQEEIFKNYKKYSEFSSYKELFCIEAKELLPLIEEIEKKREHIFEGFSTYTERDMCKEMEYLHDTTLPSQFDNDPKSQGEVYKATKTQIKEWYMQIEEEIQQYKSVLLKFQPMHQLPKILWKNIPVFNLTRTQCDALFMLTLTEDLPNYSFINRDLSSSIDDF